MSVKPTDAMQLYPTQKLDCHLFFNLLFDLSGTSTNFRLIACEYIKLVSCSRYIHRSLKHFESGGYSSGSDMPRQF